MPAWSINKTIRTPLLILGVCELLILYLSICSAAIIYCGGFELCGRLYEHVEGRAAVYSVVLFAGLISTGLYDFHQRFNFQEVIVRIMVGLALGTVALATIFYAFPEVRVSKRMVATSLTVAFLALLVLRYLFMRGVDENGFRRRTLVYGAGNRAGALADLRRKADRRGFKIVGSVPAPGDAQESDINGLLIRNKPIDVLSNELDVDEIVIAMDERRGNLPVRELLNCKFRGIEVIGLVEFIERETGKIRIDLVDPSWLIFSHGFCSSRVNLSFKRLIDVVVGVLALLISWPLLLLISLGIKIEDGISAPIFYGQTRVGYRGINFNLLKFRSMCEDAEADGKAVWAEKNDARITKVGHCLRKFRLDELPQVFNVIRGQMSLVGPRPERPEFVEQLAESIPFYMERHAIKPGLTGWAQIRYSYGSTEEDAIEKLQYDLYYAKNHNFLLDLAVILQTVEVVLWGKGAR